jgi:hypothetical protein
MGRSWTRADDRDSDTSRVGGAIEYPFIFGLEQAGPESNLATPAQLDAIGFASKRLLEVHS